MFPFVTVFTAGEVDGESAVSSITVHNDVRGIGLPVFDDRNLWSTRRMEHLVLMGNIDSWDDDPLATPRAAAYAYAPSTVAVLAHETGHRWLTRLNGTVGTLLHGEDRHWNFFLDSGGSLLGGSQLRDMGGGAFATGPVLEGFGALDQYLMGLREPAEVGPFFLVENPHDFSPPTTVGGQPWSSVSRPHAGLKFRGRRRDLSVNDVIASEGSREPPAGPTNFVQRMAFVLVVPAGGVVAPAAIERVDRIRRAFGGYFLAATGNRARIQTWLPRTQPDPEPAASPADATFAAGEPRIVSASLRSSESQLGRRAIELEFADFDGDVVGVEASTDATDGLPPASRDVVGYAFGHRRGHLTLHLSKLPEAAREFRLSLVDRQGRRSAVTSIPIDRRDGTGPTVSAGAPS